MKRALLIHIGIIYCHMYNVCYKHCMRTKCHFFSDTTLNIHRTIFNHRRIDFLCLSLFQIGLLKLIHIPSGTNTTKIRSLRKLFCSKIHHKLSRFMQRFIRMSLRTNRNVEHGRIGTYRSCPGNCYNIIIPFFIPYRYHDRRKRI